LAAEHPVLTCDEVLARAVASHPDREALVSRHTRYTYGELDGQVGRAAGALAALGVGRGDRVAMSLANHADIVVAFLGAMRLGAIWVGVNRPLAPPEKAYILRDAQVSVFLGDEEMCAQVASEDVPELRHVLRVDPADANSEWPAMVQAAAPSHARKIDAHAPAAIAYTGGTTGFPKGVIHSQHNMVLVGAVHARGTTWTPDMRQGVLLPLTILNLMVLGPIVAFELGTTTVAIDTVDPLGIARWVRAERIATFSCVPAILHALLTHSDVTDDDLRTLVRPGVGGADCPQSFRDLYRARFGAEVLTGYGLTEAPTAVTIEPAGEPQRPGGSGVALPHVEIRILDDAGNAVPTGETGEICVAPASTGPFAGMYRPMLGYWNRPDATADALRDGVLHTGDIGLLDADGHLFVKDRKHDLIIRGGANVYPAEVERVLHDDPRVAACAVVGVPDIRLGERVAAAIQVVPGSPVTADELRERCASALARYKVPEQWLFVAEFTRTPMGKIRKAEVRDWFAAACDELPTPPGSRWKDG
jgi:long-chain acyl-CoA synthetase